jgi:hypothetical protein
MLTDRQIVDAIRPSVYRIGRMESEYGTLYVLNDGEGGIAVATTEDSQLFSVWHESDCSADDQPVFASVYEAIMEFLDRSYEAMDAFGVLEPEYSRESEWLHTPLNELDF